MRKRRLQRLQSAFFLIHHPNGFLFLASDGVCAHQRDLWENKKTRLVTLFHVTCYNKVIPHVASAIYRVPTAYGDGLRGLQNTDITNAHGSIITDLLILSFLMALWAYGS